MNLRRRASRAIQGNGSEGVPPKGARHFSSRKGWQPTLALPSALTGEGHCQARDPGEPARAVSPAIWRLARWPWVVAVLVPTAVAAQSALPTQSEPSAPSSATASASSAPVAQLRIITVEGEVVPNDTPAWETTLNAEELDTEFVQDWSDLSRLVEPGVTYERGSQSINIRGLDRNRVLTTIDGIRLPWLNDGTRSVFGGLDSVPFGSLAEIDIYKGADSSAAGSGALGGLVSLRTLDPDDVLRPGESFGVLARTGYRSDRREYWGNAAVAGRQGDSRWLLQAGGSRGHELENMGDVGGYGPTRTEPNPEDRRTGNVLAKFQQRLAPGHEVGVTGEWFRGTRNIDTQTAQGTTYAIGANSTEEVSERQRVAVRYDYDAAAPGTGWIDDASTQVYWQRQHRSDNQDAIRLPDARAEMPDFLFGPLGNPYRYPTGPFGRSSEVTQSIFGWQGDASRGFQWGSTTHRITASADVAGLRVDQYAGGYDNCPAELSPNQMAGPAACEFLHVNQADTPKVDGMQWSIALRDDIDLLGDRVRVTPALRYDHYRYDPKNTAAYDDNPNVNDGQVPASNSDSAWSPSLTASWEAMPELVLHARWAMGFLAPTAAQLYRNFGGPGTYLRVGNPNLDPERSQGWELGARWGDRQLGGSVVAFDNRYRNFIDDDVAIDPASIGVAPGTYPFGITGVQNRDRVRIYGAEATAHWGFASGWRTWASVAWAVGKDQNTDTYLNSVPPLRGVLGLGYEQARWGSSLTLTAARARDKVEDPASDFEAPGYGVVDLTAYWEPSTVRGLRLQAGVFNVFDRKYWNALNVPNNAIGQPQSLQPVDFYTEPGRNVQVSLTYRY